MNIGWTILIGVLVCAYFVVFVWCLSLQKCNDELYALIDTYLQETNRRINLNAKLLWKQDTSFTKSIDDLLRINGVISEEIDSINNKTLSNEEIQLLIEEKVKMFIEAERLEER